ARRCASERLVMWKDRYIHSEFGLLAPTPRFRRELRIAFFALLVGICLGVVLNAMRAGGSTGASPAVARAPAAASPATPSPKVAQHSGTRSSAAAPKDRSAVASAPDDRARGSTAVYPAGRVDGKAELPRGAATSAPVPDAAQSLPAPARSPSA